MPPFTVLHVCMGNICRSPMAERLLVKAVADRVAALVPGGGDAAGLVYSHSAGTGGWHEGEGMNPPAGRQVVSRGASTDGFTARKLRSEHIDAADLVLTATADQAEYVLALRPDAAARTFVLGEFGRLLPAADLSTLPPAQATPEGVYARGVALVAAVDAARAGAEPLPADDLDDPWGRGDQTFVRIGDEIEHALSPLADVLLP
jgi:protein-tyrosine phosphatase